MCGVGSRATTVNAGAATAQVRAARDFLLNHREDYATAYRDYRSLVLKEFNWALDWFDAIAGTAGIGRRCGLSRTGAPAQRCAARPGGFVMHGNQVELWETILATMKLGAVITYIGRFRGGGLPGAAPPTQ